MIEKVGDHYKLVVFVVKKGISRDLVRACKEAGAEGGTVLQGRGTGTHETGSVFGVKIEPEKEIILCLTDVEIVEDLLSTVEEAVRLDKPGTGIAFVLNSKSITGIAHLLEKDF